LSRQAIIERETRQRPWVVAACALAVIFYLGAQIIESGIELGGLATEELRSIDENSGTQLIAAIARGLAFALLAVPLLYLFRAAQARTDGMRGGLIGLVALGPAIIAIQGVIAAVAQADIATQFVEQSSGVGDIYSLADNLRDESGLLQTASGLLLPGLVSLVFAMIYVPLWAVRTGLLTRFFGTLGMALGASIIFLFAIALLAIFFWALYLGLLLLGRISAGRPPAWDAGEAIPWPAPGSEEPAVAAAGGNGDVVEGDASEIPGIGESPNAARRERAKKRKRKRRR
jgi:hypothetical protein